MCSLHTNLYLPGDARRPHKVQRCTQPLSFEIQVVPLQGECRDNELGLHLVAAGHLHGKGHLAAVGEQAARMGSRNIDGMNIDSVVLDVEGQGHRLQRIVVDLFDGRGLGFLFWLFVWRFLFFHLGFSRLEIFDKERHVLKDLLFV
jgi:hypothetical protein